MKPTLFRCPNTGLRVQALFENEDDEDGADDAFESVNCSACGRIHLVGQRTGRVLGAPDSPSGE